MKKITIIGSGHVGSDAAAAIFRTCTCRLVLIDAVEGLAAGRALDIRQSANLVSTCTLLSGSTALAELANSDFIVITAGSPRKEGMSRFDLLEINKTIVLEIGKAIQQYAPAAVILIITNPVDLLTAFFKRAYPGLNVFGFGCSLDSYRYRYFIGERLHINPSNVTGLMIGSHNPDMIPYLAGTSVGGVPVTELLSHAELESIREQTIAAGNEIVRQLKTTGSSYTAGQIIARMARSVIDEIPDIFSVDTYLEGEMGFSNVALSLPCIVGKNGLSKVILLPEKGDEYSQLKAIAGKMQKIIQA